MTPPQPGAGVPLVLNVNDHDGARYLVSRMLADAGFAVEEAITGEEALKKVRERQPKLVILDIKLPDINGLDVCRQLKADPHTSSIKVLHTSAVFNTTEHKVRSLDSGADGYLAHPYEQEELVAMSRSLLRLTDAEQRLRDTAEELRDANTRIHQFLAMLAHELRNPLSAMSSSLPLLAQPQAREFAHEVISRQTAHLARMVDDLLDVARVTQGKIQPRFESLELGALLRRSAENLRRGRATDRRQQVMVDVPGKPLPVRGDLLRLEQVFANLLDNASKYTGEGGTVRVEAGVVGDNGNGQVRVLVSDTGIGIPAESLPKIFDLFSQAEVPLARSGGGLGVGLTVVRSLVELHGGSVTARSAGKDRGTQMEVRLPFLVEKRHAPRPGAPAGGDPAAGHAAHRVLIVEDNIDAQQSLKMLLEMLGHEVHVASDGVEGVSAFLEVRPDIALIDIGLPRMDGYEVARRLRQDAPGAHAYLVALTGYGDLEQRDTALRAGFDVHVVKPAEPAKLDAIFRAFEARSAH